MHVSTKPICKFSVFPYNVEKGGVGDCYNAKGKDSDQQLIGSKPTTKNGTYSGGGFSAWRNKFYQPKVMKPVPFYLKDGTQDGQIVIILLVVLAL